MISDSKGDIKLGHQRGVSKVFLGIFLHWVVENPYTLAPLLLSRQQPHFHGPAHHNHFTVYKYAKPQQASNIAEA
jgi:hypothetical protein